MTKRRLSEKFREQLNSLGESLARHTRSLDEHFDRQKDFLLEREVALDKQQKSLEDSSEDNDELSAILAPFLKGDFKMMTVPELRKICTANRIKKVSHLRKAQLLKLLGDKQVQPPTLPIDKVIKKLKRSELEKIVGYFLSTVL